MKDLAKVIYLMGPPGAGKGTQAELLARELGYDRFSTGDAFRAIARQDTPLGKKVKETIDNGILMPPEMAAEVVISAIEDLSKDSKGLIFDGTPRTVKEAEMVDEFFVQEGSGRPLAVFLNVDKDEMMERNSKRRFCLDVAGDFPVISEEDEKKCLELGGTVGIRPDDEPQKFATRWSQFMDLTWPVIEKYRAEGILQEVDGKAEVDEVHRSIMNVVKGVSDQT